MDLADDGGRRLILKVRCHLGARAAKVSPSIGSKGVEVSSELAGFAEARERVLVTASVIRRHRALLARPPGQDLVQRFCQETACTAALSIPRPVHGSWCRGSVAHQRPPMPRAPSPPPASGRIPTDALHMSQPGSWEPGRDGRGDAPRRPGDPGASPEATERLFVGRADEYMRRTSAGAWPRSRPRGRPP